VTEFRTRRRGAFLHDILKPRIARDLPLHVDDVHRHAAAVQRLRRQTRPQDDAIGQRVARGDAE